jgi:3',5'-cyclic AMP phosphodiesterase CpdA
VTTSGARGSRSQAADGSTLKSTWIDPTGDGRLQVGPGEPAVARTELGIPEPLGRELAHIVHLTDAHVMDASSPARVPFLARLGPPVQSTFRPHEALTAQVLHGAINAVRAFRPELLIQGGDLIDNAQNNELVQAVALLNGGRVHPGSGPDGYHGVQLASNLDPAYYRPDIDTPRHPGMLRRAAMAFRSPGVGCPWIPVLGDHDALVAGELVPSHLTQALAIGDRALWNMPANLQLPGGLQLSTTDSPDGPPDPSFVAAFIEQALDGATVQVPPDERRYELEFSQLIGRLRAGSQAAAQPAPGADTSIAVRPQLDFVRDVGDSLRVIVLDVVRRDGGSGGLVQDGQASWLEEQLASAGDRWVVITTHQPLENTSGGEQLTAVLDRAPRVIATLAGHTHRNRIIARETAAGGYWLITTCSLIDFPQQCRALRLFSTASGGVAIQTWMLDHTGNGPLGPISRDLSYMDAQGGRWVHLSGAGRDRNATLFRRP